MGSGYFKIWRKALDHALWEPSRARTRFEAWVFLICKAKGSPDEESVGYSNIPLKRGQLVFSVKCLAKNWNWKSRGKVDRFLNYLIREEMIEVNRGCAEGGSKPYTQTDTPYSILTITKYNDYNPLKEETDTQTDTQRTRNGHVTDIKKEVNEVNKETYSAEIEKIVANLNTVSGSRFRPSTKKTRSLISGRLSKGYTVKDFEMVHGHKWEEWRDDPKMDKYICPSTLYTESNFEKYLEAARRSAKGEPPEMPVGSGRG